MPDHQPEIIPVDRDVLELQNGAAPDVVGFAAIERVTRAVEGNVSVALAAREGFDRANLEGQTGTALPAPPLGGPGAVLQNVPRAIVTAPDTMSIILAGGSYVKLRRMMTAERFESGAISTYDPSRPSRAIATAVRLISSTLPASPTVASLSSLA